MNLTWADRWLVSIIGETFPPVMNTDLRPESPGPDWAAVIARAQQHGLTPLLFDSVNSLGRLEEIPAPARLDLRRMYLQSANQTEEIFRELAALLDSCGRAQIPVILLKGSALAVALYDRRSHRPMGDVDILIPKDSLPDLTAILVDRGYVEQHSLGKDFTLEFKSEARFARPAPSRLVIEPHWHVFNIPHIEESIPVEWFWRRTAPVAVGGRAARMLSPTATLLHLSAHFYLHHQGIGLRSLYDLARLLTCWTDQVDWDELVRSARTFHLQDYLYAALREVSNIWPVPLPEQVRAQLRLDPPLHPQTPSRYFSNIQDWREMGGIRSRWGYLWRVMFPGKEYLRERYGMRDDRLAVFYYGYRLARGGAGLVSLLSAGVQSRIRRRKKEHPS